MLCPPAITRSGCEGTHRACRRHPPRRTDGTGTAGAGMGRCQPRAGDKRGKTAASCSDPRALLGKRHLNPASLQGNSCQHGEACPATPLLPSGAKKNTGCEKRRCDCHTCELSFAQPSAPRGALPARHVPPQNPGLLPAVAKELGPVGDCPLGVCSLMKTSSLSEQ